MLQQGNTSLMNGNIQEAEGFYQNILVSQQTHSDANHNLGLIAVSKNQSGVALSMFKIAIDANPNVEQ